MSLGRCGEGKWDQMLGTIGQRSSGLVRVGIEAQAQDHTETTYSNHHESLRHQSEQPQRRL